MLLPHEASPIRRTLHLPESAIKESPVVASWALSSHRSAKMGPDVRRLPQRHRMISALFEDLVWRFVDLRGAWRKSDTGGVSCDSQSIHTGRLSEVERERGRHMEKAKFDELDRMEL